MSSTPQTSPRALHTALLRPAVLHIMRAAGFHATRPSVLDTLVNLTERYLLLLASTTATHAWSSHNDPQPTITDLRTALSECGALTPLLSAAQEEWTERMRVPLHSVCGGVALDSVREGREAQVAFVKRKRDEDDTRDVREFARWVTGPKNAEIHRVAGLVPDTSTGSGVGIVGVGGSVVHGEDYFAVLKKKRVKTGDDAVFQGTVLGSWMGGGGGVEGRGVVIEGGLVQSVQEWSQQLRERNANAVVAVEMFTGDSGDKEGSLDERSSTDTFVRDDEPENTTPKRVEEIPLELANDASQEPVADEGTPG